MDDFNHAIKGDKKIKLGQEKSPFKGGVNLPQLEEKTLKFWKERNIFKRSVENRQNARRFVFFEGPPYANGKPGIHHFLGRVTKDLFLRYKTMRGYLVERHAGWDTHGLPIEIEAEKALNVKSKKDIEKIGVGIFNQKARESIWKYKEEWERFTERIGFWLDLGNPYVTYEPKYIESLWWIISQFDKNKFLYKGHKVLPWCPRCGTALSSHEVAQGYETVTDKAVTIKFKIQNAKFKSIELLGNAYILAWTTTPWTLPGNVALAVGKNIEYALVESGGENYILAKDRVESVFGSGSTFNIQHSTFKGRDLVGLEYEPPFNVTQLKSDKSYKVYPADFVTTEEGTGIVHTAVMYGEDDYELGKKIGLPMHHTVAEDGTFTKDVGQFDGVWAKDAEPDIIKYLEDKNLLFKMEDYTHSYPFCWRCKSPLLYYARDSWFVAVSKVRKQLVKNNNKIHWYPPHLKHGRFGEFIKEAKDWAFSRERYWGTPLPIWRCQTGNFQFPISNFQSNSKSKNPKQKNECEGYLVIGSLEELEKQSQTSGNRFFMLRHGLSEKDIDHGNSPITAGKIESDKYHLTLEGREQVKRVIRSLKEKGGVDMIFSSPFLRTKETAHIISEELGLRVHFDDRLKELDHGTVCEGKRHHVCFTGGVIPDFDTKYGDGESWSTVKKRMYSVIRELNQEYQGKKILLVSHGDPLWILEGIGTGMDNDEMIAVRNKIYTGWGQLKELKFRNIPRNEDGDTDLHRPYIDEIKLECPKCGGSMTRVKEITDVWFDSGAMPYAQWHYPFENKKHFSDNFPADFIAEGIDQTRGWFYTLLAVSTLLEKGAPYKNVLSYSHVLDEKGRKMSKSIGNVVDPWEVIEKYGVDAARWYFYSVNDPADPKLFAMNDVKKSMNSFLMTVFNSLRFFDLYGGSIDRRPNGKPSSVLDKWLLSRLARLNELVGAEMDSYNLTSAARAIENFVVDDLSNWWLRRSRNRFQKPKTPDDLKNALRFYQFILLKLSKILAPFTPFISDHVYKRVINRKESVHLEDWPRVKKSLLNDDLEKEMSDLRNFVSTGLAVRKNIGVKIRQPLAGIYIKREQKFQGELEKLIVDELNVKKVLYDFSQSSEVKFDENISRELLIEGYAREIVRQIQDMRKEAGYKFDEKVFGRWESDSPVISEVMGKYEKEMARDTLLKEFNKGDRPQMVFDVEKETELAPQIKIWLGVRKS